MASREAVIRLKLDWDPEAKQLLEDIRDRLPRVSSLADQVPPGLRLLVAAAAPKGSELAAAKSSALYAVLVVLDGWIEGSRISHDAMEHRGEPQGEECWRQFTPDDIRRMVNDAAREVGISEFPYPEVPKEDTV